ncbi:MAG: hypothetical protein Q9188_006245 [Gyalolechia gomerana]
MDRLMLRERSLVDEVKGFGKLFGGDDIDRRWRNAEPMHTRPIIGNKIALGQALRGRDGKWAFDICRRHVVGGFEDTTMEDGAVDYIAFGEDGGSLGWSTRRDDTRASQTAMVENVQCLGLKQYLYYLYKQRS